jgi:hypothetical protein
MDEIFGGAGGEQMVEMLKASREELEALVQAGRDRGVILTPEEIENSRKYTRQMGDLRTVLFGIQTEVVGQLLPGINEWIKSTGTLAKENRKVVATEIVEGIKDFVRGIRKVAQAVSFAADLMGGFGNLIILVSGVIAAKFLVAVASAAWNLVKLGVRFLVFAAHAIPAVVRGLATLTIGLLRFAFRGVAVAGTALLALTRGFIGLAARAIPAAIVGIRALSLALLTTPIGLIITGVAALAGAAYLIYRNWGSISEWFGQMWVGVKAFFSQGIGDIAKDLLSFSPAALLLKGIDAVFEMFGARPLTDVGGEWIGGLWSGISERWDQLTGWLSTKMEDLAGWMPDWAKDKLGLGGMAAPQAGGASVTQGRPSAMPGPARADVGGELRIVVDSEGRPRVTEARRNGAMDFQVESGMLGVAP